MQSDRQTEHFSPNLEKVGFGPRARRTSIYLSYKKFVSALPAVDSWLMSANLFDTPNTVLETVDYAVVDESKLEMSSRTSMAPPALLQGHGQRAAN